MNKISDRYYNMKRQRYKSISKNLQTFLQQKINIKIIKKKNANSRNRQRRKN